MIRISSTKCGGRGRSVRHLDGGNLTTPYGIVFSSDALILNVTDGKRVFHVIIDKAETEAIERRFTEHRAAKESTQ